MTSPGRSNWRGTSFVSIVSWNKWTTFVPIDKWTTCPFQFSIEMNDTTASFILRLKWTTIDWNEWRPPPISICRNKRLPSVPLPMERMGGRTSTAIDWNNHVVFFDKNVDHRSSFFPNSKHGVFSQGWHRPFLRKPVNRRVFERVRHLELIVLWWKLHGTRRNVVK